MIIAITGTIGSGKSSVAKFFSDKSYPVYDSDKMVHKYYNQGEAVYLYLVDKYGEDILDETKELDRKKLASIVFSDEKELSDLEDLVYPLVFEEFKIIKAQIKDEIVFIEVPLLFEAEMEDLFDLVISVDALSSIRHERLLNKGFTKADIKGREARQLSSLEKKQKADIVIYNNRDLEHLNKVLENLLKELLHEKD